jgi:hypothetical protein
MRSKLVGFVLLLILYSCVTPFYSNQDYEPAIVIQGDITDQPGPYEVVVSKTIPILQQGANPKLIPSVISGASVIIADDQGHTEVLKENPYSLGHYLTQSIQGTIGFTYTLTVNTAEGTYQSYPEKLGSVGDFKLNYTFVENPVGKITQGEGSGNGFKITLDCDVPPEQEGRVWWRVHGTYHIYSHPELRVAFAPGKEIALIPDPPRCSGYVIGVAPTNRGQLVPAKPCTCCDCWISEYNLSPLISDNRYVNSSIKDVPLFFVEANRRTLFDKYYLEVIQLNPSERIYDFWRSIRAQRSNSSNLFQTPPPKAKGNIFANSANAIPVIGYFSASAVKVHTIEFHRSDVPFDIFQIDTIKQSCLDYWKYSSVIQNVTTEKPSFW